MLPGGPRADRTGERRSGGQPAGRVPLALDRPAERVQHLAQMRPHRRLGGFRITGQQGGVDGLVLPKRVLGTARAQDRQELEPDALRLQTAQQPGARAVVCRRPDEVVEPGVELRIAEGVAPLRARARARTRTLTSLSSVSCAYTPDMIYRVDGGHRVGLDGDDAPGRVADRDRDARRRRPGSDSGRAPPAG